ncbi:MAG: roadblock/LC7 domain-containing protein [Candidatus Syntropharchaeales archaeon]|nr:hypothetical protein [Candidatus Syntrophoarchaeum sp.]
MVPTKKRLDAIAGINGVVACGIFINGIPIEVTNSGSSDRFDYETLFAYAQDLINYSQKVSEGVGSNCEFVMLEMDDKKMIVLPIEEGGVGVLTDTDVNLGMVRVAMKSAVPAFKSYLVGG